MTKNGRKVKSEPANSKSGFGIVAAGVSGLIRTVGGTPLKKTGGLLIRSSRNKNPRVCIQETKKVGITPSAYNAKERKTTKEKKIDADVNVMSLNYQPIELCKKNDKSLEVKEERISNGGGGLCIELELTHIATNKMSHSCQCQNNKKRVQHFDDNILKKSEGDSEEDTTKTKRMKSDVSLLIPSGINQELCVGNKEGTETNLTHSNSQISQWIPDGGRTTFDSSSAQVSNSSSQVSEPSPKSQQAGFQNEKHCENHMLELLEKQQREEKEKLNENYGEKIAQLEKEKKIEVSVIGSYIAKSKLDHNLMSLDHEYAAKFESLKCRMDIQLKELETMQLTARKSSGEKTELLKTPPLEKASEVPKHCNQENVIFQPSEVQERDQTVVVTHEQTKLQRNSNRDKEIDREETTKLKDKEKQREEEEKLNDGKTIEVGGEEGSKLHDSTKSLYFSLKPEIITLCNLFQFPDNVKLMAEEFLEYVTSNHQVHREPSTILQAFQISMCQRAASILKYKFHPEESLKLAKQHLDFSCKREEVDHIYSMLKSVKKAFLLSREKCNESEPSTTEKNCGKQLLEKQQREEIKKPNETYTEETAQPNKGEIQVHKIYEMSAQLPTSCETSSTPTVMLPQAPGLRFPRDFRSNSSTQNLPTTTCEISSLCHDDPLQLELERLRKQLDQTVATHEQTKSLLKTSYAKEIADVVVQIRRKYDTKRKNLEAEFLAKKKETKDRVEKVQMQSFLAAAMRAKCNDRRVRAPPGLSDQRLVQRQTQQTTQQTRQFTAPRLIAHEKGQRTQQSTSIVHSNSRQAGVVPPPHTTSMSSRTTNPLPPHTFII